MPKRIILNASQAVGEHHVCQAAAKSKRPAPNVFHLFPNGHASQTCALVKRKTFDVCHAVRNHYPRQLIAIPERPRSHAPHGMGSEHRGNRKFSFCRGRPRHHGGVPDESEAPCHPVHDFRLRPSFRHPSGHHAKQPQQAKCKFRVFHLVRSCPSGLPTEKRSFKKRPLPASFV